MRGMTSSRYLSANSLNGLSPRLRLLKYRCESAVPVVRDVRVREVHGDFDGDGSGVIDQHEALEGLMAFSVRSCSGEHESRKPRCIVFFPHGRSRELRGELGGTMLGCLEHPVREILTDRLKVIFRRSEVAVACDLEQEVELGSMELKTVDLLMTHRNTANDRVWIKNPFSRGA